MKIKNIGMQMKNLLKNKQVFETNVILSSINEKERTIDFVMTTDDKDRHNDIVDQKTMDIETFMKSPSFFLQHNSQDFPIGKWLKLWLETNERGGLQWSGTVKFSDEGVSKEADQAWEHVKSGEMNAVSIGFIPKRVEYDEEKECFILYDCELLECSLVNTPANKFAMAKSIGSIDDEIESIQTMDKDNLSDEEKEVIKSTIESLQKMLGEEVDPVQVADNVESKQNEAPINKVFAFKRKKARAVRQMNKAMRKLSEKR